MSTLWGIPLGLGAAGIVAMIGYKYLLTELIDNLRKGQGVGKGKASE